MELSVVVTLFKSESFIEEFHRRITAVAERLFRDFEIVFVDDGSPDRSAAVVAELMRRDARIRLVELSRNFGHHHAITAGLTYAVGDLVFLIDVDLEEDPEWLETFLSFLRERDADAVYGVQKERGGNRFKRSSGKLFYKLFNFCSETKIPENVCTVRLMRREYVDSLLRLQESNVFLAAMMAWTGFRQCPIAVDKRARRTPSSYNLKRLLNLALNAVTSFSALPLRFIFFFGITVSFLSAAVGIFLLLKKLLYSAQVLSGWSSVMVSLWFLGGIIICFIGVIGIYIANIFLESKRRPTFLVRRVYSGRALDSSLADRMPEQAKEERP